MSDSPLTPRQVAFVREYAKDFNGSQAAIRAGYSEKGSSVQAARLLADVRISAEIAKFTNKVAEKAEVSVERVLKEYARIAFLNPQDFYDANGNLLAIKDMPEDAARVIAGMDQEDIWEGFGEDRIQTGVLKKIKLTGKVPALEGLARHLGMFQNENINAAMAFQINIHIGDNE